MVAGGTAVATAPPPAMGGSGNCASMTATTPKLTSVSPVPTSETGPTRTRNNDHRRSNKPIMEKRRRARINNCLNELKTLILDAMKKDPARHSKLEKADILEMTVKHLETLQRQQVAMAAASDPAVANKFRAGFTECAGEVGRFPGLDGPVKRRLLQHLANCLNTSATTTPSQPEAPPANPPLQVHIVRAPSNPEPPSNIILTSNGSQGLQLVPTRLPNGDIALILPSSSSTFRTRTTTPSTSPSPSVSSTSSSSSPLPMLIPIPNRPPASSPSPVGFDKLSVNPSRQITIVTTPQRIVIPPSRDNVPLLTTVPQQSAERVQPPVIRVQSETNRVIMIQDGKIIQNHAQERYLNYTGDRETFLHIPERDYYDSSQDRSSGDDSEEQRYEEDYYSDQMTGSPSPDSPLALVTRKYDEEYDGDERPWRPW